MGQKVTLFNRKELLVTFDSKRQAQVRNLLSVGNIDYQIKVVNRKSPSPLGGGERAQTGTFGEKLEQEYEYIIYVPKEEYERAKYLIR